MPTPSRAARLRLAPETHPPMSNGCGQTAALERIAAFLEALEAPGEEGDPSKLERFAKAADAVAGLGDAQSKLCRFLVKNRLKLTAGALASAVAVGAISPTAAEGIRTVLVAVGVAQ